MPDERKRMEKPQLFASRQSRRVPELDFLHEGEELVVRSLLAFKVFSRIK